jgi:hypothetical protein
MNRKIVVISVITAAVLLLNPLTSGTIEAKETATKAWLLEDLLKPEILVMDETQMYVAQEASVFIYSLKDFKLIKKFGKPGEGPEEFLIQRSMGGIFPNVQTENIIVNSFGKLSWFTKNGKFIKEFKTPTYRLAGIQPLGKNFVALTLLRENQKDWFALNLYDDRFNKLKEIHRAEQVWEEGKGLRLFQYPLLYRVYDNKFFITMEKDFIIKVVDTEVNELYTVKHNAKPLEITEQDKKETIHFFKTARNVKGLYEMLKPLRFPKYYPAIQDFYVTGNKIYVITYKTAEQKTKTQCLIFDINGKFLKSVFIPLKIDRPQPPYLHLIHEGFFYRLEENMNANQWWIHVTEIK